MIRILFSSAGRRVERINCFRRAAEFLNTDLEIISIDLDPSWSPACQIADYKYKVPRCSHPQFFDCVLNICKKHGIDLVIPNIDTELIGYARNLDRFSKNNTDILIAPLDFVDVCRDKEKTAQVLGKNGIPVPHTWKMEESLKSGQNLSYPVLIKPRGGSSGKGVAIINTPKELMDADVDPSLYIVQELCVGKEYTINCFYDRTGKCVSCIPHFRKFVRAGEVCFAQTVRVPELRAIAHKFSGIFPGIRGVICFQAIQSDSGAINVFEINARFGGGYPVCDRAGGTFAKWILQEILGEVPDYNDDWQEGVRMLRYDTAIFYNLKQNAV